jgi:hypothetical protein
MEEAQLMAMFENAKESSSWQGNVENTVIHFMLPGRLHHSNVTTFMDKIDLRSLEILQIQHNKIDDDDVMMNGIENQKKMG